MNRKQHTNRPFDLSEIEAMHGPLDQQIARATTARHLCALLLVKGGMSDDEIYAEMVRRFAGPDGVLRKQTGKPIIASDVNHWRTRLNQGRFPSIGWTSLAREGARAMHATQRRASGGSQMKGEVDSAIETLMDELRLYHDELLKEATAAGQAARYEVAQASIAKAKEVNGLVGAAADLHERWRDIINGRPPKVKPPGKGPGESRPPRRPRRGPTKYSDKTTIAFAGDFAQRWGELLEKRRISGIGLLREVFSRYEEAIDGGYRVGDELAAWQQRVASGDEHPRPRVYQNRAVVATSTDSDLAHRLRQVAADHNRTLADMLRDALLVYERHAAGGRAG